jgi:hypothetical protein
VGASLLAFGPAFGQTKAAELDDVIHRHTLARGGAQALDAVHYQHADIDIVENGSAVRGLYQCAAEPAFRIDIYDKAKHVFCEGLDSQGPWLWPGDADRPRDGVPDARKTGLQGIEFNLYGLHRFAERGHRLSLDGRQTLDGVEHYVIRIEMQDSYETFLFIDPATWLVARRRDFRSFHPDVDPTRKQVENRYFDYRPVAGVLTSFAQDQYNLATGARVQTTRARDIVYRPSYDPAVFARTAPVVSSPPDVGGSTPLRLTA